MEPIAEQALYVGIHVLRDRGKVPGVVTHVGMTVAQHREQGARTFRADAVPDRRRYRATARTQRA